MEGHPGKTQRCNRSEAQGLRHEVGPVTSAKITAHSHKARGGGLRSRAAAAATCDHQHVTAACFSTNLPSPRASCYNSGAVLFPERQTSKHIRGEPARGMRYRRSRDSSKRAAVAAVLPPPAPLAKPADITHLVPQAVGLGGGGGRERACGRGLVIGFTMCFTRALVSPPTFRSGLQPRGSRRRGWSCGKQQTTLRPPKRKSHPCSD